MRWWKRLRRKWQEAERAALQRRIAHLEHELGIDDRKHYLIDAMARQHIILAELKSREQQALLSDWPLSVHFFEAWSQTEELEKEASDALAFHLVRHG
jgi:hypothetical protein